VLATALVLGLGMIGWAAPVEAQAPGGVNGRVYDDRTGRGLSGAIVTVGYETQQLATVTGADGRYAFAAVAPAAKVDVIAFVPGYAYLLQDVAVTSGRSTGVDFGLIPEPNPDLVPTISDPKISVNSVEPGAEVTFSMRVRPGSEVPLSPEIMVMNPVIGRLVLLTADGDVYRGTWRLPADLAEGIYDWTFFAVDWACREPSSFPVLKLAVTAPRLFPETGRTVPGAFVHYWQTRGGLDINGYPVSEVLTENGRTVQYFQRARFEYFPEHAGTPYEVQLGLLGRLVTAGREQEAPFQRVPPVPDTSALRYFEQTGHTLGKTADFKTFWESNGALAQFGYPISEEFTERSPTDGQIYTVQYFERYRFEYHPNEPNPFYRVQLGLLGKESFDRR
jgi:hypothetical protein